MKVQMNVFYILVVVTEVTVVITGDYVGHQVILVLGGDHVVMVTAVIQRCGGDHT